MVSVQQRILALDPARSTGYAHWNGTIVQQGTWQLEIQPDEHPGVRIKRLVDTIAQVAEAWGLDLIAYEDAAFGSHNLITQLVHAEFRGAIKLAAAQLGNLPMRRYNPLTIKKYATGNGHATKDQMMLAHRTHFGFLAKSTDECDARFILEMARAGIESHAKKAKTKAPRTSVPSYGLLKTKAPGRLF